MLLSATDNGKGMTFLDVKETSSVVPASHYPFLKNI